MNALSFQPCSLIIDDEIDICFLLAHILNRKNINSFYAYTLADGRRALKQQDFDFVFLDNYLPDGEGTDIIPALRKDFPDMVIIMISAYATMETRKKMIENQIDYFLQKPLSAESIDAVLDKVLNKISKKVPSHEMYG
jgi:DNA-binding NtrC family response regulator